MAAGYLATLVTDPCFWAFLGAVGWGMGFAVVGTRAPGRRLSFGVVMLLLAEIPRIVLPLPFVIQPRAGAGSPWMAAIGVVVLLCAFVFATPVVGIAPLTAPDPSEPLRTEGLYSVVRHPLMLCDLLWPIGWSLVFGSVAGLLLTPVWFLMIWLLTQVEEESLVRAYGGAYRAYQKRVPRLIPRASSLWRCWAPGR